MNRDVFVTDDRVDCALRLCVNLDVFGIQTDLLCESCAEGEFL